MGSSSIIHGEVYSQFIYLIQGKYVFQFARDSSYCGQLSIVFYHIWVVLSCSILLAEEVTIDNRCSLLIIVKAALLLLTKDFFSLFSWYAFLICSFFSFFSSFTDERGTGWKIRYDKLFERENHLSLWIHILPVSQTFDISSDLPDPLPQMPVCSDCQCAEKISCYEIRHTFHASGEVILWFGKIEDEWRKKKPWCWSVHFLPVWVGNVL